MLSNQFLVIGTLVYAISLAITLILATIHTVYGGKELRKLNTDSDFTQMKVPENARVMHTFLALDSAKILSAAVAVIIVAFTLFMWTLVDTSFFPLLFYLFIAFCIVANVALGLKIDGDVKVNRVSAVRYEMITGEGKKPPLEFVPDVLFRPLRKLITKNMSREGSTKIGVVTANRKIITKNRESIVFDEKIRVRNTESFSDHQVRQIVAEDSMVSISSLTPPVPLRVPAQKTVIINIRCSMSRERPRGPMLIRITAE